MKTDTADPTEWYNVSEMCQSTRNDDSQELTTGVHLNVINSLWHEFFNSIHPSLSSGNKKWIFLAAPTVCNPVNCCADVSTYIDFGIHRIWTLITCVTNAVGKGFICSNNSSECALSESAIFFFLNMKTDTADPTEWYYASEMSQSTRNNDSQEVTTNVYLNVINSLWHEFFNSIHPNLSSGNKNCIFLAAQRCVTLLTAVRMFQQKLILVVADFERS